MHTTHKKLTALASLSLVACTAAVTLTGGCKGGSGAGGSLGIDSITGLMKGGGGPTPAPAQPAASGDSFSSGIAGMLPGNAGGYFQAGMTGLSALSLSDAEEGQIGRSVAVGVTNTYRVSDDQALNDYVALVGYTVVEASPRSDRAKEFVFGVLDTPEVGAFSGPGGYVMITRGAVARMRDESELAGVLGHEIAHVCNEDGMNAVRNSRTTDAVVQAASTALKSGDRNGVLAAAADSAADATLRKPYDKSQELSADRTAVQYVTDAGYDPAGYQHFVQRIADAQGSGTSRLFSTHPGFDERTKVVADAVAATGKAGTGATNQARFEAATGQGKL